MIDAQAFTHAPAPIAGDIAGDDASSGAQF